MTLQRRAVYEAVADRDDHPTADEVAEDVRRVHQGVSRATVYRALETFVDHHLLAKICHPGAAARFDAKTHRHHHLVCDRCGAVRDLVQPEYDTLPVPDTTAQGFRVRDYSVHLRGLCMGCVREENQNDD